MNLRFAHASLAIASLTSAALVFACGARTELEDASLPNEPIPDAGPDACSPVFCPSATQFDPATCTCVPVRCPDNPPHPLTIASNEGEIDTGIAVYQGDVYWTVRAGVNDTGGSVRKVSRCGGPVTTIATDQIGPTSIAVDGANVYWGTIGNDNTGVSKGTVMRAPTGGGTATLLASASVFSGQIAIDSTFVYSSSSFMGFGAWKVPIAGGEPVGLVTDQVFSYVAVDANQVYLSQSAIDPANGRIVSVPLAGGEPKVLVPSGLLYPGVMVVDDVNVYYESADANGIRWLSRVAKTGGVATEVLQAQINGMAVDVTDIYWAEGDANSGVPNAIKRFSKNGGPVKTLATTYASAIAVDETYVYWLGASDVLRMPK